MGVNQTKLFKQTFDQSLLNYKNMDIDETLKLALEFHNTNDLERADKLYNKILELNDNHSDANHLSGVVSLSAGRFDDALVKIQKAIAASPNQATYYNSLGNVFKLNNEWVKAESAYFSALNIAPRLHEAHHNLGRLFERNGNLENAKFHLIEAIHSFPGSLESNFSLARVLLKLGKVIEAVNFFQEALQIEPNNPDILNGLAYALEKSDRLSESIGFYEKSLRLEPNVVATLSNLGHALHLIGRAEHAVVHLEKCVELEPENQFNWDRYLFALIFSKTSDRETIFQENKRWAKIIENKISFLDDFNHFSVNPDKKLRIGYYSKEFYSHVTSFFFETLLKHHDRQFYEIYCYFDCTISDEVTENLRQKADVWEIVSKLEPNQIAQKIRSDRIDIFVGTTNFLASNRIISAYKPAPIVVSYMNQVSSTGLFNVDYLITDDRISPTGQADNFFTEKLVRLSDYICYQPPELEVEIKSAPVFKNGYITFGCFNNLAKINQTVISTWATILRSIPNSRIKLITRSFKDKTIQTRYLNLFKYYGIENDRIDFLTTILDRTKYLKQYNLIDIALDPFPFNGGTVTDETIYMGVPLITLAVDTEMGSMGKSKLSSLKMHDLIAYNKREYIEKAINLSNDINKIQEYKRELRKSAIETIFNGQKHVNELEIAYRQMWKTYCAEHN